MGTRTGLGAQEASPRFKTQVAPFCLDRSEVTVQSYSQCVDAGECKPRKVDRRTCNYGRKARGDHPINCVNWHQAAAYCSWRGARLPSEVQWEYAARGGPEYRRYSWGNEPPDGRTCWKHVGGSCKVGEYSPGAFGLLDITGNVWEWTDTWFGPYPWPPVLGESKVYRGGSWSRRFAKWMSTQLRNRYPVYKWGSHLGFRCALTPPEAPCPYGRTADQSGCLHGVDEVECSTGRTFNGARCAREGAPLCAPGRSPRPGHGCVVDHPVKDPEQKLDLAAVRRRRSPEFDSDCQRHYAGRPHAWAYSGGTHDARNVVSGRAGCSNRDVGVGWNSACCP